MRRLTLALIALCFACDDTSEAAKDAAQSAVDAAVDASTPSTQRVAPGEGLFVGDQALRLGDPWSEIEARFEISRPRDLGAAGRTFEIPSLGVSGLIDPSEGTLVRLTLTPSEGWDLSALDPLAATNPDPFLGVSWFPDEGVGVAWEGGVITRVELFVKAR